jgi:hypothetical protein
VRTCTKTAWWDNGEEEKIRLEAMGTQPDFGHMQVNPGALLTGN